MKNKKMRIPLLLINSFSTIAFAVFYIIFLIKVITVAAIDPDQTLLSLLIFGILTAIFFVSSCTLNFLKVLYATREGFRIVVIYYFVSILLMPIVIGTLVNLYINIRVAIFEINQSNIKKLSN